MSQAFFTNLVFRIVVGSGLIASVYFRFNGFSLVYLIFLLALPCLPAPDLITLRGSTGSFLRIVATTSFVFSISQLLFISVLHFDKEKILTLGYCGLNEKILRNIGLTRLDEGSPADYIRHLLPDGLVFATTIMTYIYCRKNAVFIQDKKNYIYILMHQEYFQTISFFSVTLCLAFAGICLPSLLSAIYFLLFLFLITWWSAQRPIGYWFSYITLIMMAFSAGHLVFLYMYQFQFMQDSLNPTSLTARLFGITGVIYTNCFYPQKLMTHKSVNWTHLLNPVCVYIAYTMLAIKSRHWFLLNKLKSRIPTDNRKSSAFFRIKHEDISPTIINSQRYFDGKLLPREENHVSHLPQEKLDGFVNQNFEAQSLKESSTIKSSYFNAETARVFTITIFQFLLKQSNTGAVVVMMVWGIMYHGWTTFVLLLWASMIWMWPNSRKATLASSPLLVLYGDILLVLQYFFSLNLTEEERRGISYTPFAGFSKIGFYKPSYPAYDITLQVLCCSMFWATLRNFISSRKKQTKPEENDVKPSISLVNPPQLGIFTRPISIQQSEDSYSALTPYLLESMTYAGIMSLQNAIVLNPTDAKLMPTPTENEFSTFMYNKLKEIFTKYWVVLCVAMFLFVSLEDDTVVAYKIVYMMLFLIFVAIYRISFRAWRVCMAFFWWVTVIYSISVLVFIYTYQFQEFPTYWHNITGMETTMLNDLGLEQYDISGLFTKLLTPTAFVLVCNIQLHYFHKPLLALTLLTDYPPGSETERHRKTGVYEDDYTKSVMFIGKMENNRQFSIFLLKCQIYLNTIGKYWWRILEVHMVKFLSLALMLVSLEEVCAVNFLLVLCLSICLPWPRLRWVFTTLTCIICSLMVLFRMIFQLGKVNAHIFRVNCTSDITASAREESNGTNSSSGDYGSLYPNATSNAHWAGFHKTQELNISLASYVRNYIIVILLLLIDATVMYHQRFLLRSKGVKPLPRGIIIAGQTRSNADQSLSNMCMYLVNFCFFKFGLEITHMVTVIVILYRLDFIALIYWIWLVIIIFLPRGTVRRRIWPFYVISLSILLPFQYILCLGLPPSLCIPYPWFNRISFMLATWLYLPNYIHPPEIRLLLGDFIQLLCVCLQWQVFEDEKSVAHLFEHGGSNEPINFKKHNLRDIPVEDFMMYGKTILDRIKMMIFGYMYWFTFAIVYLAGVSQVSALGLGYICLSFYFFWKGQDLLIKERSSLIKSWNKLIFYNLLVIAVKVIFQVIGCVYSVDIPSSLCWLLQLFSIVCHRSAGIKSGSLDPNTCDVSSSTKLYMDALCFIVILLQRKIYTSYYFFYVVLELQEQTGQASRGAFLINSNLRKQIKKRQESEKHTIEKIRKSMERIRRREMNKVKGHWEPQTHSQAIFSGYLQFESMDAFSDDESDLDRLDDSTEAELQNKAASSGKRLSQGPLEFAYAAMITGAGNVLKKKQSATIPVDTASGSKSTETQAIIEPKSFSYGDRETIPQMLPKRTSSHSLATNRSSVYTLARDQSVSDETESRRDSIFDEDFAPIEEEDSTLERPSVLPFLEKSKVPPDYKMVWTDHTPSESDTREGIPYQNIEYAQQEEEEHHASPFRNESKVSQAVFNWARVFTIVFLTSLDSFLEWLYSISTNYRYVAFILRTERQRIRQEAMFGNKDDHITVEMTYNTEASDLGVPVSKRKYNVSMSRNDPLSTPCMERKNEDIPEFKVDRWPVNHRFIKLLFACYYATISNSELICYFIIVINMINSASIIALPLPILVFLWAMLSVPRPSKRFWVLSITYTELVVILKYLFQFGFYPWNDTEVVIANEDQPFWWPRILGIERNTSYAHGELALLLALFFHRSILKMHGLWRDENSFQMNTTVNKTKDDPETEKTLVQMSTVRTFQSPNDTGQKLAVHRPESYVVTSSPKRSSSFTTIETSTIEADDDASFTQKQEGSVMSFTTAENAYVPRSEILPESPYIETDKKDGVDFQNIELSDEEVQVTGTLLDGKRNQKFRRLGNRMRHFRWKDIWRRIANFYRRLVDPTMSAVTDVYAAMFFFDLITFLILVFNWWAFSDIDSNQNVASYLEEDRIPSLFLFMLLSQFVLIIIDRALYLRKFVLGKFIFQIGQVIGIHIWMFFLIPHITNKKFTANPAVQMWYFFRCIYFGLSAIQIKCGYPTRILGNFLAKRYSLLNLLLFKFFRTMPFLLEIRALMDWMWTDSSLMLFHWIRLEDIYASVFCIKCGRKFAQDFPYKRGAKRSLVIKYGVGGSLLITLILIIWFPLLFMSLVYSAAVPNVPTEAKIEIVIGAYQPIFIARTQQLTQFSSQRYQRLKSNFSAVPAARSFLKRYQAEDVVEVKMNGNSIQMWGASKPSREDLLTDLVNSTKTIKMQINWYIHRNLEVQKSKNKLSEQSTGRSSIDLKQNDQLRKELASILESENNINVVSVRNLFPKYVRVRSDGTSESATEFASMNENSLYKTLKFTLKSDGEGKAVGMEWWEIEEENSDSDYDGMHSLSMITFNQPIVPPSVSYIAGYGIIGLYLSLVLVIGKFVRMFVSGISYKIPFDELPNVDKILKLCLDIFLCREVKEFGLEEDLFAKVIHIYRSTEMLIKWTKLKLD